MYIFVCVDAMVFMVKIRFMKVFTPVRPTLYQINELFFNKNPEKIKQVHPLYIHIMDFTNKHE